MTLHVFVLQRFSELIVIKEAANAKKKKKTFVFVVKGLQDDREAGNHIK